MGREGEPRRLAHLVEEDAQRPLRGDPRIELPQRSGGAIARVHEGRFSGLLPFLVHAHEVPLVDEDLPARLEDRRRPSTELQGDHLDGAQIRGDVLASETVPAGGALHEPAVLVPERDRQTIELRLHHVSEGLVPEQPVHAGVELEKLVFGHRVGERHHLPPVRDLGELLARGRPDAPGGRIGRDQVGVVRLELLELAEEAIVLGVAQGGRVQDVVAVARVAELGPQLFRAGGGVFHALRRITH